MLSSLPFETPTGLLEKAKQHPPKKAAISGADTTSVMESVKLALDHGLIIPVLVGDLQKIKQAAGEAALDIAGFSIIEAIGDEEIAKKTADLVRDKSVDLVMKGHVHTDAMMAALLGADVGLLQGKRLTHVFHMTVPGNEKPLLITDGALNVAPNQRTLMACLQNAVDLAIKLGIERPKAAILSATESPVKSIPTSLVADEIATWGKENLPEADTIGPLAFDVAVSPEAAKTKGLDNPVAGNADILVVPNIETGNALFKMLVYFKSACAAGVVLGGSLPVTITSRADPPEARLASVALAVISAS